VSGTDYSSEIWAPELHYLNGKWYIYVAASGGRNETHRMYVMESKTEDPMDGFDFIGKINSPSDKWAIDGTVMRYKGKMYFIWSGWEGDENIAQNLYIAEMHSPLRISSGRVKISSPELEWELYGNPLINEGPVAIEHNGLMHIMYSANVSWLDEYCVGLLTLTGTDPLDPSAWTKKPTPVLEKAEGMYGPGHPSIVKSRDGREWIIYHANRLSRTGWRGRSGWAQLIIWDKDNYPSIHLLKE
jgi:GH43 family beta-xylosidase